MEDNNVQNINIDANVHDFINQGTKEWNIHSISNILPPNVLSYIKSIPIPLSPMEDRILWGYSQDGKFTLKSTAWPIIL